MGIVVSASGRVSDRNLKSLLVEDGGRCLIDLRTAHFVEPVGLVAVALMVERAARTGLEVDVLAPVDDSCRNYLSRMQLGAQLDALGVEHQLGVVHANEVNTLCELRRFGSEAELVNVAEVIIEQYEDAGWAVVQPLYSALFELGVNAVDHSGQGGGYVALQTFSKSQEVAFAVADSGVGLRERTKSESDGQAIAWAAQKYNSRCPGLGRGRGIAGVIELTERHRGSVSFYTGEAQGDFSDGLQKPHVSPLSAPLLGTLVSTRLSQRGD